METSIAGGMCRCCASEGAFKDIKSCYTWMGEEEVYADMLKECFDVHLSISSTGQYGGICEVCVTQLRNAANFKKQVLQTEEQFQKFEGKFFSSNIVKIENQADDTTQDNDSDDNQNDSIEDNYSATEYEVPIKSEVSDEKPRKRAKGTAARAAKKAKIDQPDTSVKRVASRRKIITLNVPRPETEVKLVTNALPRWLRVNEDNPISDIMKNKLNLKNILHYSNANPLRCKTSDGYGCGFCPKYIQEADNLKTHFAMEHRNESLVKYLNSRFFDHVLKLDISYLKCTVCHQNINMLEDLIRHLKEKHGFEMFTDAKHQILPFRFETDELRCAICSTEFPNFKLLQEHMNSHFRNYICSTCGAGFVTERLLTNHVKRHPTGEFKCTNCDHVFDTKEKLHGHVRRTHLGFSHRNKCRICGERFADYWKKVSHMVKEHGTEPVVLKCQACDRTFNNQRSLSRHTKKDHLLERRHKCAECDMKFFGKNSLMKHMAKHTGERSFKCDVCSKAYGRKNTLREHMRIHNNDRRFSCDICGQAFVQKCSWKCHMRSKHGEGIS